MVSEVLAASDLHVVASRPYPVARSTFEALAAGALVLALDVEPVARVPHARSTHLLVPPDDPDATFEAARLALDDLAAVRPLADAGSEFAREWLSRDATLPDLARLFDRLASRPRRSCRVRETRRFPDGGCWPANRLLPMKMPGS